MVGGVWLDQSRKPALFGFAEFRWRRHGLFYAVAP